MSGEESFIPRRTLAYVRGIDTEGNVGLQATTSVPTMASGYGRRKVGVIGDSIGADAISYTSTLKYWTNWAWIAWMRRYCGPRIDLPMERVYAVGGAKLSDVYNATTRVVGTQLTQALADNIDICIVHIGTNSIGVETTANMVTEYTEIFTRLRNNGTFCIIMPIRVHNSPLSYTGTDLLQFSYINNWIEEYSRTQRGMLYLDVNQIYMDFSTGNAQSIYLRDGVHDNQRSAQMMGKYVGGVINSLIVDTTARFMSLGDVYDATNNRTGNLVANGLLAGSAGSLTNGATGAAPTSWTGSRAVNSGTVTAAFSKITNPALVGLEKTSIQVGGTADGNDVTLFQYSASGVVSAGDSVYAECEIDYNITTTRILGIQLELFISDSGFAVIGRTIDGYFGLINGTMAAGTDSLTLRTDPIVALAGATYITAMVHVATDNTGALNDVVNVGRISARKV